MATPVSRPLSAADRGGTHAAMRVLAVLVLVALALGIAVLMNPVVPAQVPRAVQPVGPTVDTPAQNVQPTAIDRTPGLARPQPNPYPR